MNIKDMEQLLSKQRVWYFERYKNYGREKYNHNVLISNYYPNYRIVAQNKTRTKWKICYFDTTNPMSVVAESLSFEQALQYCK